MKKTVAAFILVSSFLVTKAQVATFLSLGSATVEKDAKGSFIAAKIWIIQEMHINVNLTQNKLQFYSKGIFDRDTFNLRKEIVILDKITPSHNDQILVFSGIDELKRKCIIRFKAKGDDLKTLDGELQIEYFDHAEIYSLRKLGNDPAFNKTSINSF